MAAPNDGKKFTIQIPAPPTDLCSGAPGPTSPRQERGATRAREATAGWKPALDRRTSYAREDQKHEMQMGGADAAPSSGGGRRAGSVGGAGFSEVGH